MSVTFHARGPVVDLQLAQTYVPGLYCLLRSALVIIFMTRASVSEVCKPNKPGFGFRGEHLTSRPHRIGHVDLVAHEHRNLCRPDCEKRKYFRQQRRYNVYTIEPHVQLASCQVSTW